VHDNPLMRIAVFGATGRVGTRLIKEALARGYSVAAYARSPQKIAVVHPKLLIVQGGLEDKDKIEEAVKGADVVVSVMGPVGRQDKLIFSPAYESIVQAMKKHGVKRIIALGTPTIPDDNDGFSLIFWSLIVVVGFIIRKGHEDIRTVGTILRKSGLDWTLVRVPLLTNGRKRGRVTVGYFGNGVEWPWVSRADFVDFLLEQLTSNTYIGKAPAISN